MHKKGRYKPALLESLPYSIIPSSYSAPYHKLVENKHRLWFYFCGFNVAIISGLFVKLLGKLLRARFAIPLAIVARPATPC